MSSLPRPFTAAQRAWPASAPDTVKAPSASVSPVNGRAVSSPSWLPLRDAIAATAVLIALIAIGSGGGTALDPALMGYLGATLVAAFGTVWRLSAFWRRPASAFYVQAWFASLAQPRRLGRTMAAARSDLLTQTFIRKRSVMRWMAHMLLSLGTLASFAMTIPLVFGWMYFVPAGARHYRVVLFTVPTVRVDVDGVLAWLLFHGLSLAAIGVVLGASYFLAMRLRTRRLPGATASFAIAPLVLLLVVALTGLALPASRGWPTAFRIAAALHQVAVVVLLIGLPFSKLGHLLIRPLQLGARAVRSDDQSWQHCGECGARLAPTAQQRAVATLLAQRGMSFAAHLGHCQTCRRRRVATAQAALVGSNFQPRPLPGGGQRVRAAGHCEAMPSTASTRVPVVEEV